MKNLFFMGRHGETFLNDSGLYRGWSDGPDAQLNEDGHNTAEDTAKFLASLKQPFSHIISSPLNRAMVTAAIIAQKLGIKDIIIDERLRPLNVGDFAGTPKKDNSMEPFLRDHNKRFPNGETINEFEKRQEHFQQDLLDYIEEHGVGDRPFLILAHVSNMMYQVNERTNSKNEKYLSENTDIVHPGGLVMVTPLSVIPIFRANLESMGIEDDHEINEAAIKGEPGTGYESGEKGPFRCSNCEYFRPGENSCGQKDMKEKSQRQRTSEGRVLVQIDGCCEFINRLGK